MTRSGKQGSRRHLCLTSLCTSPDALLRLIRQRWSLENEWHWARDAQLGQDAHRYANRTGASVFAFLQTVVMNPTDRGDEPAAAPRGLSLHPPERPGIGLHHQGDAALGED